MKANFQTFEQLLERNRTLSSRFSDVLLVVSPLLCHDKYIDVTGDGSPASPVGKWGSRRLSWLLGHVMARRFGFIDLWHVKVMLVVLEYA